MRDRVCKLLLLVICCWIFPTTAASLADISVDNGAKQATVTLQFTSKPRYSWFVLHNPERFVIDLHQSGVIKGLPLKFAGKNLVQKIRTSRPSDAQSIRLVFELNTATKAQAMIQQQANRWLVQITLSSTQKEKIATATNPNQQLDPFIGNRAAKVSNSNTTAYPGGKLAKNQTLIVAIDAGHGGQDPGAIGQHGLKEKNVTIAIARKLRALLNADPMFKAVLTRNGDYFISVMGRSEVARKENASLLVSIHADSAPVHTASGASVWVLSNRRANSELANWLEKTEKQSELLGGAGDVLANSQADPYLSQAVLDLQFGHSQRVGYDVATRVLQQLRLVTSLHKRLPEHASLGVLRSPDIPSLLVETGFISNLKEERLLGSATHQNKIATAIYQGLKNYFRTHPYQYIAQQENRAVTRQIATTSYLRHKIKPGETLSQLAVQYGVSINTLISLNRLKKPTVWIGQNLKIPNINSHAQAAKRQVISHQVVKGETLTQIASRYGVTVNAIQQFNHLQTERLLSGQTLMIPRH